MKLITWSYKPTYIKTTMDLRQFDRWTIFSLTFLICISAVTIQTAALDCSQGEPLAGLCCGSHCDNKQSCPTGYDCSVNSDNTMSACCAQVAPVPANKRCDTPSNCDECNPFEQVSMYNNKGCGICECVSITACRQTNCAANQMCLMVSECESDPSQCQYESSPQCYSICELPLDNGPCNQFIESWYYDSTDSLCKSFNYGGCRGNKNRFASKRDCLSRCANGTAVISRCPDISCSPCKDGYSHTVDDRGCPSCECQANSCEVLQCGATEVCEIRTPDLCSGSVCDPVPTCVDYCHLPVDRGTCKDDVSSFFYNPESRRCEQFSYTGCGGNRNRFTSIQECTTNCDLCSLPSDTGPCEAATTAYYYDPTSDTCKTFVYGGCLGNDNNFVSQRDCEDRCKFSPNGCPMVKCEACEKGQTYALTTDGCQTCICVNDSNCQDMDCEPGQACRMVQVQCITTPCDPVASCIDDPCEGRESVCDLSCVGPVARDPYGCSLCFCVDPQPSTASLLHAWGLLSLLMIIIVRL